MAEGYLSEEQLRSLGDLECHTWGEVEVPETFRDLEITIGTPPVDFLQYQEGGGNI
jgi:hypothetical protein